MLDENLPAFFYKRSVDGIDHHTAIFLSHRGSEPEPVYTLQHADPSAQNSRNCYAAALFDCYNPDVLYGEVLVRPGWTQPSLSQEEIRRNGGVPPPPAPVLPTEFIVQLYNPDQQVTVVAKPGTWGGSTSYEFSMPQTSFRTPSASALDRTQHDPAVSIATPKLNFVWRKESKLSKDLTCYMTGKSTDAVVKKKNRDPDITISLFRSLRELTIYEPNLYRVELEDPKGLEVVLLLASATIKDLYFGTNLKEIFNINDVPPARLSSGGRKLSSPVGSGGRPPANQPPAALIGLAQKRKSLPRLQTTPPGSSSSRPPPMDPRAQWEIDAETARLRAQTEAEQREEQRREAARRREREKADEAETRRLKQMLEAEKREARQKQEAIDRETERLRRQYGAPQPALPQRPVSGPSNTGARLQPQRSQFLQPIKQPQRGSNGLYLQPPNSAGHASTSALMSGANPAASSQGNAQRMKKKSFFGLRSASDDGGRKLNKKASAMW